VGVKLIGDAGSLGNRLAGEAAHADRSDFAHLSDQLDRCDGAQRRAANCRFGVIFAMAVIAAGDAGKPVLVFCESLTQTMFKFAGLIMKFAPIGVGAAIAVTVGHQGLDVLINLGKLVLTLYSALIIFIVFVFGAVIIIAKIPFKPFVPRRAASPSLSRSRPPTVKPRCRKRSILMERLGVPPWIVGFVLPAWV